MWALLAIAGISGQSLVAESMQRAKTDQMTLLFFAHLLGGIVLAFGKSALVGWEDIEILRRVFSRSWHSRPFAAVFSHTDSFIQR